MIGQMLLEKQSMLIRCAKKIEDAIAAKVDGP